MKKDGRGSHLQVVASELRVALGGEARHLVKVIPNLGIILGEGADHYEDQDCANAQARIQHLLCLFVDVISSSSRMPILLFLDDLQWSDRASLSAINHLLKFFRTSSNSERQFFFLGSCREEALMANHPFGRALTSIRQFGVHAAVIKLACFDKDTTNRMVSDLLCLSPRLTRTLSEIIHHKSQGNPFFFSQLMASIYRDGLVRLSLSRRRWEWDEDKIQSTKLPDDVVALLSFTIERSSNEVQNALCALSCFGARSDSVIMKLLEAKLSIPLIEPLQVAVAEGIVDMVDGSYSFSHDRLQEAAYSMMNPEDRCLFHFKYGVALVPSALDLEDDAMLFIAANQINLGGIAPVKDSEQALLIANLNLTAGCKAMEMSDFPSAYSFLDHGISFLPKGHWQDHYDLSIQIFDAASKCALVNGNFSSFNLLTDQSLKSAKRFEDKLNIMLSKVTALSSTSKLSESFKMGIDVLSQLGEPLPESISETDVKFHVEQTMIMLQRFSEERELIEYKRMTDTCKIMVMKFLWKLVVCSLFIRQEIFPLVTVKMVQLSIAHGMSPVSSIGFAYFGQLVAKLGYFREGCRYVKVAKMLLDRIGSKEVAGEVIAVGSQVLCFVEPLQTIVEFHAEGYTIASAAGDLFGASGNTLFYCIDSFWAGVKLAECKERHHHACRLFELRGNMAFHATITGMEKNIRLLIGVDESGDESSITDDAEVEAARDLQKTNPVTTYAIFFQKMYIHFIFCKSIKMKESAELFFGVLNPYIWVLYHYSVRKNLLILMLYLLSDILLSTLLSKPDFPESII
jgi:predicted ATPase